MITANQCSTFCLSSCINGGEEPHTAILTGGRHPGQYFLTGGETMDILMGDKVITILLTGGETMDILMGEKVITILLTEGETIIYSDFLNKKTPLFLIFRRATHE